ncbi:MAG: amino acid ABC transporter permease, partial [Thiothrix sp.]
MRFWRKRSTRNALYQFAALGCIILGIGWLADNTLTNMRVRGIQSGFDFLNQPAGFEISASLFGYTASASYAHAFLTGLGNTLNVAMLGIVLATL